jgi:hypothetical protein
MMEMKSLLFLSDGLKTWPSSFLIILLTFCEIYSIFVLVPRGILLTLEENS